MSTAGTLAEQLAGMGGHWPVLGVAGALATTSGAAVLAIDRWTPELAGEISEHAWRTAVVLLPVRADGGTALVGPLLHEGAAACLGCVEVERLATLGAHLALDDPGLRLGGAPAPVMLPLLAALADDVLSDPARAAGLMWAVRSHDGTCSGHRVRPRRGGCPVCGPLPADTADSGRFTPSPRPLADPYRLRQDNPRATGQALRHVLHDWRLGPVAHVSRSERLPLAIANAEVVSGWSERDGGYGRATNFRDAERVALLEAAERMAGMAPRGRRTVLRASFAELGPDRALDPARLGLPEPRYHDHPAFRLTPYTPDLQTSWVHGWSFTKDGPLAVPEQAVYYARRPARPGDRSEDFMLETSNGCGLGNSLEEAVLYALFEVAERDAFLMAWYARTPLRGIAVPAEDDFVAHLADRFDSLGYDLLLFDATNDFAVPVVLSMVLCRDAGSAAPQAFLSAGAHLDPREAIRSAVVEIAVNLVQSTNVAQAQPSYFDRDRLRPMLAEPELVVTLGDHVGLHTLPEARARFGFLLDEGDQPVPWRQIWPERPRPVPDLGAAVTELAGRLVSAGMDVVVIEQSDPIVRDRLGLHAVKVLVPGAVPLTFGHVYRRTRGLARLLDVPWRLGRLPRRPRYEDLPLDPHPFP